MELFVSFLNAFFKVKIFLRRLLKYIIHFVTGKCELERICARGQFGFRACIDVENSLKNSKYEDIQRLCVLEDEEEKSTNVLAASYRDSSTGIRNETASIIRIKNINGLANAQFQQTLEFFVLRIKSYNRLLARLDQLSSTSFDDKNSEHRRLLFQLWTLIKGGKEHPDIANIKNEKWREIGFQGKNPATDFRGMGLLGLINLVYLFENRRTETGMKIFTLSKHPSYGFMFAVGGIYFTSVTLELLKSGKLKRYLYNLPRMEKEFTLEHFQDIFAQIYLEFSQHWVKRKPQFGSFGEVVNDYMKTVHYRINSEEWVQNL